MASENAEHNFGGSVTSGSGGSKTSGSGGKAKTGTPTQSFLASLFGFGNTSTVEGATPAGKVTAGTSTSATGYKERYPQWHSVYTAASKISGVDTSYFDRLAHKESTGKAGAHSPLSTAKGLFQFTKGTAAKYGLTNPYDPTASGIAVGKLTRDSVKELTKVLGRAPTQRELYLSHQQGLGGAKALLSNPNKRAVDVVGRKAVVNNAGNISMTARQFAEHVEDYFSKDASTRTPISGARKGGGAVQNDVSVKQDAFWNMMIGSNDPAEIDATVQSIKAGEIGIDTTLTGSTGVDALTGGVFGDIIKDSIGGASIGGAKFAETAGGKTFGDVMSSILGGDIGGAVSNLGGALFPQGVPGLFGGIPALGIPPQGGQEASDAAGGTSVVYEYFQRVIVIVLGLIFVAVGLALFAPKVIEVAKDSVRA